MSLYKKVLSISVVLVFLVPGTNAVAKKQTKICADKMGDSVLANKRKDGKQLAREAWRKKVVEELGPEFSDWKIAKDTNNTCIKWNRDKKKFMCHGYAEPCAFAKRCLSTMVVGSGTGPKKKIARSRARADWAAKAAEAGSQFTEWKNAKKRHSVVGMNLFNPPWNERAKNCEKIDGGFRCFYRGRPCMP